MNIFRKVFWFLMTVALVICIIFSNNETVSAVNGSSKYVGSWGIEGAPAFNIDMIKCTKNKAKVKIYVSGGGYWQGDDKHYIEEYSDYVITTFKLSKGKSKLKSLKTHKGKKIKVQLKLEKMKYNKNFLAYNGVVVKVKSNSSWWKEGNGRWVWLLKY